MPYKYCIVPNCPNTSETAPKKVYVGVPLDPVCRKNWREAMAKISGSRKGLLFSDTVRRLCCVDHFDLEKDSVNYMAFKVMGGHVKIKKNVIPHIYNGKVYSIKVENTDVTIDTKEEIDDELANVDIDSNGQIANNNNALTDTSQIALNNPEIIIKFEPIEESVKIKQDNFNDTQRNISLMDNTDLFYGDYAIENIRNGYLNETIYIEHRVKQESVTSPEVLQVNNKPQKAIMCEDDDDDDDDYVPPGKKAKLLMKCEHCNRPFVSMRWYKNHLQTCRNVYTCDYCKKTFKYKHLVYHHIKKHMNGSFARENMLPSEKYLKLCSGCNRYHLYSMKLKKFI